MTKKEIYISIDIEADGPVPGLYSMLSFGAVAFEILNYEIHIIDEFNRNLVTLTEATQHPKTMEFWAKFPEMYQLTRENMVSPWAAMPDFAKWLKTLPEGKIVALGYPATYDFKWIDYYFWLTMNENPFGFSALDMKSYAHAILKHKHFNSTKKSNMPKVWFPKDILHTHDALKDAREQAHIFVGMRKENLKNDING